jgi:DNA-binding beta-propeller fold protein YncE
MKRLLCLAALLASVSATVPVLGQNAGPVFLVSANDGKAALVDGVQVVASPVAPDTVSIFDISVTPPRLVADLQAPTSVVGPPESVAIAPNQSIALVTGALKVDPADRTKTVPDDVVSVIDLGAAPPRVTATLRVGSQPSGVSINRAGTLALVANRNEGTVSVLTIAGKTVTVSGKVDLGAPASGPSHVAFSADGRTALVTRNNDHFISVLDINPSTGSGQAAVTYAKRDFMGGLKPYGVEVTPAGDIAVAANTGVGPSGGPDTLVVIDMKATPPRVIDQIAAGPIVEGISISPNGSLVAVTVMNGSNLPKASPFFNDGAILKVYSLKGQTLVPLAERKIGRWCQGTAWSPDSRRVFVQCMVEKEIQMFTLNGATLATAGALKVNGGPAGIRTAK